jgi:hypothetical protein
MLARLQGGTRHGRTFIELNSTRFERNKFNGAHESTSSPNGESRKMFEFARRNRILSICANFKACDGNDLRRRCVKGRAQNSIDPERRRRFAP